MISPPAGVRIWLAAGATDMRRGFDGLASLVAQQLNHDPFSGQIFAFKGRKGHLIKLLFWDGQGLVLYAKRLERGHFVWPSASEGGGAVSLTPAQLAMLTEGIDWRTPVLSIPVESSPNVPIENSPVRYNSVASVSTWRLDIGEFG